MNQKEEKRRKDMMHELKGEWMQVSVYPSSSRDFYVEKLWVLNARNVRHPKHGITTSPMAVRDGNLYAIAIPAGRYAIWLMEGDRIPSGKPETEEVLGNLNRHLLEGLFVAMGASADAASEAASTHFPLTEGER